MIDHVYFVHHVIVEPGGDPYFPEEREKFIGVFSSYENAVAVIASLRSCPGFLEAPDIIDRSRIPYRSGFWVEKHWLDRAGWEGGFFSEP